MVMSIVAIPLTPSSEGSEHGSPKCIVRIGLEEISIIGKFKIMSFIQSQILGVVSCFW